MSMKEKLEYLRECLEDAVKNPQYWTKVITLVLNTVVIMLWRIPEDGESGLSKNESQECLFAHTVPGYEIVLAGLVLIYLLGEEPGQVFLRLFLVSGVILFAVTGVVAIYNTVSDPPLRPFPLTIGSLCLVIAVILFIDELLNEELIKTSKKSGEDDRDEDIESDDEYHES